MSRAIVLNQSSYKDYNNCKRLFAWRRLQNLQPPTRRSALEIGTAVHAGLATYHAGGIDVAALRASAPIAPPPDAPREVQVAYSDAKVEYDLLLAAATDPAKTAAEQAILVAQVGLSRRAGPGMTFEDKSLEEASDIVNRVLPAYIAHYSDTGEIWKPLNQEIECLVEVGEGTNNWLRMRTDNLSTAKGGLYIVDYKTAGRMDPRDLLKYELDTQLSAYIYGLTKFLTEEARKREANADPVVIRGAIIDVLVKTQIPQFARELYTRTVDELEEFEAEWNEVSDELRGRLERVEAGEPWKIVFYRNTDNCFRYGACPFRDVCLKDTEVRRALYDKRTPDYVDDAQNQLDAKETK